MFKTWAPAALATLAVLLIGPIAGSGSGDPTGSAAPSSREIEPRSGWTALPAPLSSWQPILHNPASVVFRAYAKGDLAVGLHVGVFHRPTRESKLTAGRNRLLEADGLNREWKLSQQGTAALVWGGEAASVRSAVLIGSGARLVAWQWYWIDGRVTADPAQAAWLQMLARLRGRGEESAWIAIYTRDAGDAQHAVRTLAAFVADMGPAIDASLGRAASGSAVIGFRD
jgi:EpsI family protein